MSPPVKFSIFLINLYKKLISPFLMKSCRFEPTCSSYSLEAFKRFGFVIGLKLTVKRIIRCHPWGGHGYDPVPNFEEIKKIKKDF
ncbi:MAG: membrane protein insertion efficiency factor YidD [Pseudomonadota bacterium]|nr:membrane protein insertion efficiency factor YidD [Pseudomonadota bacterium]MEC7614784.1 membrane protein insertion efficiency factor YidD [Pseudomonadota bacterium]MEC7958042.1 membrane protein insertion efficiency factor YidD [Pseudomonadota bacterium]MEC7961530.1 membrane protein insertion efficiency factor YidD [Pseudomonadota bacterium]MEC8797413.1 membrane protein insertion efficiency factor YidD [Pseudomonadota bacterium]